MASIVCGWCNTRSHMTRHGSIKSTLSRDGSSKFLADAAFICDNCGRMSVATWLTRKDPERSSYDYPHSDGSPLEFEEAIWSPSVGSQKTYPDVPERIAETAAEAQACHANRAFRAAVLLARTVVESSAKARGIESGNLYNKITEMASRQLIRQAVAEQAHEIRHFGNAMAHGDLDDVINSEDSEEVLFLMEEVLREAWQAPNRRARLTDRREARRAAKDPF